MSNFAAAREDGRVASAAVVLDIGGTTLRIGRYDAATQQVSRVRRVPAESMAMYPNASVAEIQRRIVDQIVREVAAYRTAAKPPIPSAVGLAFAGPVARGGVAVTAPSVWGPAGEPLALRRLLEDRLGLPTLVVNDLTAAAWRYAESEAGSFCLITVSSGIGNKIFTGNQVMIDDDGFGGELGHWTCDTTADALRCDCGGRGHLGAYASGRGALMVADRLRLQQPELYARSVLSESDIPDTVELVKAIAAADPFATEVLRVGLRHLATAMSTLFAAAGIRRYLIMGGFAQAIGARYLDLLGDELVQRACFGLSETQIRDMVTFGEPDDDHGIVGVGRLVCGQHRTVNDVGGQDDILRGRSASRWAGAGSGSARPARLR